MILKLSLDLPDDGSYIPLTRHFGRVLLEYLKVVREDIGDVDTIVTELVTNVVRHANSVSGRFQLLLEYYTTRVDITVVDTGEGFSFREVPEVGSVRPDTEHGVRLGGFGLPLLYAISDHLEFFRTDPNGSTICARKQLHYESQHDADAADAMGRTSGGDITVSSSAIDREDLQYASASP